MADIDLIPGDLRALLLEHYWAHRRDLPWRHTTDPYHIWVSEIMLQQTQVKTVLPRYQEFLEQFPDIATLASVSEETVCEAWAGLGYYRRARNLRKGAQYVVEHFGGVMPRTAKELQTLPGVGRYTAGAIASIAFGEEAPLVDGNVVRFFARLFGLPGDKESTALKKRLWVLVEELVIGEYPGDLNQALMEQGATVCTPSSPDCRTCAVSHHCVGYHEGEPEKYPAPSPKKARKKLHVAFGWHSTRTGLWLEQRGMDGLWPGLWELPSAEAKDQAEAVKLLGRRVALGDAVPLAEIRHQLTHRDVTATVYALKKRPGSREQGEAKRYAMPLQAPLSALARKAIMAVQEQDSGG